MTDPDAVTNPDLAGATDITGVTDDTDDELLVEQRDFYDADALPFDRWLGSLVAESNDDPTAVTYRVGRRRISDALAERAPLGRVLEIAAGTGRLAELYVHHAEHAVLLDSSPASLALARARLADGTALGDDDRRANVELVEADVFSWDARGRVFDTVLFSAWLHHVPHSRFDEFWATVGSLLAPGGEVVFDFADSRATPPGRTTVPDTPAEEYRMYAPVAGISTRDNFGRRWRVVHILWDPDELAARLGTLGWEMAIVGPGLFGNVVWASARQ